MAPCSFLSLFILLILQWRCYLCIAIRNTNDDGAPPRSNISIAVQEELLQRGFPVGLIPGIILSYTLRETDGHFEVNLEKPCHFTIPGDRPYHVSYASSISGTISQDYISDLRGVSVKAVYKWWPITAIRAIEQEGWGKSKKQISFEIDGALSVNYPASNFDDIPECESSSSSSSSSLSSWQIL